MPGNRLVGYRYDEQGNRISVTPPGKSAHTFGYSPVDLITNYTAPGAAALSTVYNVDREINQVTRPGGQVISFGHDAAGRPGTNTIAEDQYRFAYLANGLLASLSATSGVAVTYQYDGPLNTNLLWTGVVTGMIGMAYDNDFRMVAQVVNGTTCNFGYDADGLLVNAGSCTYVRSADNGLLMSSTLEGVADAYAYNEFGEVTNYVASTNGNPVYAYACAYDPLGRITNRVEIIMGATSAWAYAYDLAGRLAQVVTNDGSGGGYGTNLYTYDANGNRTNWSINAVSYLATNDSQDRLVRYQTIAAGGRTNDYGYNAAGDLTNVVVNGTSITYYACDALGALRQVALPDGGPVTNIAYLIDGRNRRIGKRVDGLFTNGWIYANSMSPVAELGATTNLVSVFVYGRLANVPDYLVRASVNYRILTDHLGSPRLIVRADTGEIAQRLDTTSGAGC
jgi:YD repeat-containing protein